MVDRVGVTLADVARRAGVSLATASRALNGSDRRVQPEYVDRVLAAAAELRYSTNVQAQAVARGTTNTLALVVGDIADPYFASIAAGAISAADAAGLVVTMTATGGDAVREHAALATVSGLRPRAVVIAVTRRTAEPPGTAAALAGLVDRGADVVVLGSDVGDEGADRADRADVDEGADRAHGDEGADREGPASPSAAPGVRRLVVRNRAGASELARALADIGHRDFAVLAGDPGLVTPAARAAGFLEGLAVRGITPPIARVVTGAFSRDGGHDAMATLLDRGERPGCVFAVTDVMAVGALAAIREHGLEPGVDVAVAGFDDVRMLADVVPALSTVRLPLEELGARAVRLALGGDEPATVSGSVVLRASTPPRD